MRAISLLLFLLAPLYSLSPHSSSSTRPTPKPVSVYESTHKFRWDEYFVIQVEETYGDQSRFFFRLAQVWCESAFNPRATSDFGGWKKAKIDTVNAIKLRKGAAGLTQFVWDTAQEYGAVSIDPNQAAADTFLADIYNPFWSLRSMNLYAKDIERFLLRVNNASARRKLRLDIEFLELCVTASYNTGPNRMRSRLDRYGGNWPMIKHSILQEPREYAEKIQRVSREMQKEQRWRESFL